MTKSITSFREQNLHVLWRHKTRIRLRRCNSIQTSIRN